MDGLGYDSLPLVNSLDSPLALLSHDGVVFSYYPSVNVPEWRLGVFLQGLDPFP